MDRGVHQLAGLGGDQFARRICDSDHGVVLAYLNRGKAMVSPPLPAVAKRCSERITGGATVLPPLTIGSDKTHRMKTGDVPAALIESTNLIGQAFGRRVIVIVEVGNYVTGGALATEVALVANVQRAFQMYEPDPGIIRHQVENVRPVRQNQQLRVSVRLSPEAPDGMGKPPPPILRQAKARHETKAARLPRELPAL